MIHIISQPPNDEFTSRLFFQLLDTINEPFDAYYAWSNTLAYGKVEFCNVKNALGNQDSYWEYIRLSIKNNLVVIAIKDHLTSWDFNPWHHAEPPLVAPLTDIFEYHSDKKFIILTSLENLEFYINYKNVVIIPWGGDITNQMIEYKQLPKFLDKNLNSDKTFLSLNRNQRTSRIYFLSFLLGLELENYGLTSCMFKNNLTEIPICEWNFSSYPEFEDIYHAGYHKMINNCFSITDTNDIYHERPNDNYNNFLKNLVPYYQNTFIEFINETSYTESAFLITEKTANCFYGCSFPIWISSPGIVNFLRSIGLDVFDDIIDHSYDAEQHPIQRMHLAITKNIHLLVNPDLVKQLWVKNKDRFSKNIDFMQNKLYDIYSQRAFKKFVNR